MRLTTALIAFVMLSFGCEGNTAALGNKSPQPTPSAAQDVSSSSESLPAPKTHVTFQSKNVKAIPMKDGKFAYQVVNQWVFTPDDKDESLICVSDDKHCIKLLSLQEQLSRPANDPLGIR